MKKELYQAMVSRLREITKKYPRVCFQRFRIMETGDLERGK